MDEFVERLAGIGVPAVIFLIVMSTTGLAGAAAVTTALATLGPFGMISGIGVLILTGAGSSIIAKIWIQCNHNSNLQKDYGKGLSFKR